MRTLLALTLLVPATAAGLVATRSASAGGPLLASASLSESAGFVVCRGPRSATVTVSRSSRPQVLARVKAVLPATVPPSSRRRAIPDTGTYTLRLVFRNGARREYENTLPRSLGRVGAVLKPLVHLCGR